MLKFQMRKKTRNTVKNKNKLSSKKRSTKPKTLHTLRSRSYGNMKVQGATKVTYMGIEFKSKLEFYMYKLLEESSLNFAYEKKSFKYLESIDLNFASYENCKGKGYIKVSNKIRSASYKPDFIVETDTHYYIIETKGFKTDIFQLRFKCFKHYLNSNPVNNKIIELHLPTNHKDCLAVVEKILKDVSRSTTTE